jgi:hypothetical protein
MKKSYILFLKKYWKWLALLFSAITGLVQMCEEPMHLVIVYDTPSIVKAIDADSDEYWYDNGISR